MINPRVVGNSETTQKRAYWKLRMQIAQLTIKSQLAEPGSPQLLIASHSPYRCLKPDCVFALRRKAGTVPRSQLSSAFSAVRFTEELSRKMGIFRVFRGKELRNFSAVKTYWRRKCDSNSHYRFESRNPRRLRNLQVVQHFTGESTSSDWPLVD